MPINIFLVDDHQIVRQGLRSLLERQPDLRVIGDCGDGKTAVQMACDLSPDIVIMDIALPGLSGIEATRRIRARCPAAKVIALSMHADKRYVIDALRAGAMGYLLKESAYEELVAAIHGTTRGQIYLSQKITDLVVKSYIEKLEHGENETRGLLSAREREVWQLLAEGYSNNQIAEQLSVSVRTVECHRKNLMEKLNIHSVADLVKRAIREGVITLEAG